MRPWMAELLGLAIGFALGGAALVYFWPQLEALRTPAPAVVAEPAAPPAMPEPAPLPRIAGAGLPYWHPPASPPPLPDVVHPDEPSPATARAGTGFFIAGDGTLLTAAHVARDCGRLQVVSRYVRLSSATLLASDTDDDIAMLRADRVRAPAVLPLGRPAGPSGRVFVLGYPARAGPTVPEQTWGTLENARLPNDAGKYADPGFLVWLEASAVTHGYSGGPILDPRDGAVVGLVKGMVDTAHLHTLAGMPGSGVTIGPGAGRLIDFVQQQAPWLDVTQVSAEGDSALALARQATVHVLCWPH